MMATLTIFIVPAWSDQAGQCRIVAREGRHADCLQSYRANPAKWREIGLMNSRGAIVCLDASEGIRNELKADEPLAAGVRYVFEGDALQ
jgi:hypothetical protein